MLKLKKLEIHGREYHLEMLLNCSEKTDAPRLVIVSRQVNRISQELVRVCIQSIRHFTEIPYELWVVDNNSPHENVAWLRNLTDVNVVFNRTEPRPPDVVASIDSSDTSAQLRFDSYSNAIALEIAARLIDPSSRYLMTLHMDTMAVRKGWLAFLLSKIEGRVRAAGVRMDTTRTPEGVLHVLGYAVDFQLFRRLKLDFLPDLPRFDVGDRVTRRLRDEGYEVFACRNTLWNPSLTELINVESPFKNFAVDRSFDDDNNVIFLHLGRGVRKSIGEHTKGTMADEWIHLADNLLFNQD